MTQLFGVQIPIGPWLVAAFIIVVIVVCAFVMSIGATLTAKEDLQASAKRGDARRHSPDNPMESFSSRKATALD